MSRNHYAYQHYTTTPGNRPPAAGGWRQSPFFREGLLWKLTLLSALAYFVWDDQVRISFNFNGLPAVAEASESGEGCSLFARLMGGKEDVKASGVALPTGEVDNLTFAVDPGYARRNRVDATEVDQRLAVCRDYVERFAPVAVAEMRKYRIPASIVLAQALLESNAGESDLAQNANNHFGIKCFSKHCKRGHCVNATDDTHKDFFVKYQNIWASYRAHSEFLQNTTRYRSLFHLSSSDYEGWAKGLAKAGYATDRRYAEKLIAVVKAFNLDQYDRQ